MLRTLYIFFFMYCLSCWAFCSRIQGQQQYDFKNFQVNDGLSSNTVTCVLQDKSGFLWIGTRSGLNRYDGRHFKVFRNERNAHFSLGNNGVLCLFEDSSHHIWIGTYTGIYVYYPEQEKFLFRKDLPLGEIRFIHSTQDGYIWIGTHNQLYRYQPWRKKLSFMRIPQGETLVCNSQNDDANFWIGSGNRYLLRYDTMRHLFKTFQLPETVEKCGLSNIQDMASVGDSAVIIGTMKGAFYLQMHTHKIIALPQNGLSRLQIHQILQRNRWEYWFGTENGVIIYNIKDNTGNRFSRQANNPYSLTDNVVYALCKDSEDGVWIGTFFGGLNYYSHNWNFFRRYFPNSSHSPLSGHIVHEITEDDRGHIWVGTEDGGLDELSDGSTRIFLPDDRRQSIAYKNIHGIAAVGNELWIGTYEHGLDVLDIPSGKVIRHYQKGEKNSSLDGDFIVTIYKGQQDKIYVGTWNSLFEYDREKNNFRKVPFLNVQIQQVAQAQDGILWVASYGKGIYFYNEKTGQHGHLSNLTGSGAIASNYVNNITLDNNGKIWVATENGLFVYDPKKQQTQTFPDNFGFSHGQIFKIVQDNYDRYWISTSNGLYCYDPVSHKQWQYTIAYGLPSQQFNYNSGFKDSKGNLYFGTVNGMIRFYPPRILDNSFDPPVFITGWKINNIVSDSLLITNSHSQVRDVRFYYYQSNFSFDVSALTYALPGTTKLVYKLENFDKEWNAVPVNGNVLYPKLSPGKYIFKVKNADKNYPGSESSIAFTIAPPLWASVWAYILYVLVAGGIIYLLLRYYFLALKEKQKRVLDAFENEKQKEIYASKIDFFTHVAHEIRTPLTLIKLPLEKLKEKDTLDEQSRQNITIMEKNTNRLIDLTNELLDFRKAESNNYRLNFTDVDITRLVQKAVETFRPLADQKSMQLSVDMPRLHLIASVDAEAMQKILNNLVNNAVKYGASKVQVLLEPFGSDDTYFTIRVSSDGPLIPKDKKSKIFEPFARLEETAKEVGTGIGLPLSRALTQLHNGTLELDESNELNMFTLHMPVEQSETIHIQDIAVEEPEEPLLLPRQDMDADKANLLLAEDNIDILLFVQKELKADYNIFTVQNGRQALEFLDEVQIDLVVTDIMMPVMDGMELCQKIKEDMHFSHIPVIMLTAKNTLASKIEGLETGADAYIEKPFSMDYLRAQIKSIIQNRQIIVKHFASSPLAHIKSMGMNAKDKDFLDTLQNLINANIMSESLDVRELASMLNMSKATLYRKIKSISKLSPNELINLTRLKRAAELLAEGKYRISEVAVMTGYTVQGNFSRDFSKQFGMTPSQFMETIKK